MTTRLETLAKTDENKASIEFRSDKVVHHDLKNTIIMHNDTIRCLAFRSCRLLEESFSLCFLLIQSLCVVTIALGGFYILCIYNDAYKLLRVVAFYTGTVLHLLYLHYVGQQIIDSSEKIFNSAYSSEWYLISTNARKLTKVIMVRSLYPCHLTAGKITSLSMETFGSVRLNITIILYLFYLLDVHEVVFNIIFMALQLMKTSMSYFTVLLSLE
ncbi:hypothetical protein TSAR_002955 [Trichomalopsis sarcophagae]|uniref:Odorant receptor n=1 Tax=Trichomalopsis sarcophagae TaxID=543379 RepID=A0A232FN19_9HYME|nr:hypothetical protein TSAR_002955 [Trichomalopsis sarcophagae]